MKINNKKQVEKKKRIRKRNKRENDPKAAIKFLQKQVKKEEVSV